MITGSMITVRSAQLEDVPGMAQILVQGFQLVPFDCLKPIAQAGLESDLRSRLSRQDSYRAFVAVCSEDPQPVVGMVEVTLQKAKTWGGLSYGYLASLTVVERYRRSGIAGRLVQTCEQQVSLWNRQDLYLHVVAENWKARRLYLSLGYRIQNEITVFNSARWVLENHIFLHRRLVSENESPALQ